MLMSNRQMKKKLGVMLSIATMGTGLILFGTSSPAGAYCQGAGNYNVAMGLASGGQVITRENSNELCNNNNTYYGKLYKGNFSGCATANFNDGNGWVTRGTNCGVNTTVTYTHVDPNTNGSILSVNWGGYYVSDATWGY